MIKLIVKTIAIATCIVYLACIVSCANNPFSSYNKNMHKPIELIENGKAKDAKDKLKPSKNALYFMEHGTIEQIDNKYLASQTDFNQAQQIIDNWYKTIHNSNMGQIADGIQAGLINSRSLDYIPKDYEKVMLIGYRVLNWMYMNNAANARIEITRMYMLENMINDYRTNQYTKEADKSNKNTPTFEDIKNNKNNKYDFTAIDSPAVVNLKNSYQNAFSHYLAGFFFQSVGEDSMARPGYIKSLQLNPNSELIGKSIQYIDNKKNNTFRKIANWQNQASNEYVDLLIIKELELISPLKSTSIVVPFDFNFGGRNCVNLITVAFPEIDKEKYQQNSQLDNNDLNIVFDQLILAPSAKNRSEYEISATDFETFTNFDLMQARYLHDNLPNIFTQSILHLTRDIAMQQMLCRIGGRDNPFGQLLAYFFGISTIFLNQADERMWSLLPNKILLTRVRVAKGIHIMNFNSKYNQYDVSGLQKIKLNDLLVNQQASNLNKELAANANKVNNSLDSKQLKYFLDTLNGRYSSDELSNLENAILIDLKQNYHVIDLRVFKQNIYLRSDANLYQIRN